MRKTAVVLAAALLLAAVIPALAQRPASPPTLVRLEGWVVDQPGGRKHANAESKDLILEAHERGAPLVLVGNDNKIYDLVDQEKALEQVGHKVKIFGRRDGNNRIDVGSYAKVEDEKES